MRLDLIVRNRLNSAKYAKNELELRKILSDMVNALNAAMEKRYDCSMKQARIAIKGIRNISKTMNNNMTYICGQYDALIDGMCDTYRCIVHMDSVNEIMSANTAQIISKYLWKHKCTQKDLVLKDTKLAKDLFDTYLEAMIDLKIVRNDIGPDCEWVELSAEGYEYMRKHYFEKEGFKIW